jgi:uncharacterized 2Fe-2S/4Fe-4S cluster protein (DUF4445 family)
MSGTHPFDFSSFRLPLTPLVTSRLLPVERPSLRDNTALAERLVAAVRKQGGFEEVSLSLETARRLNMGLFQSEGPLWAALSDEDGLGRVVEVRPGELAGPVYGLAVDLGSTTLVLALVDLEKAGIVQEVSLTNPQTEHGLDILTRIHFADKSGGHEKMAQLLRAGINEGTARLCAAADIRPSQILAAALAGNTTMTHFCLGLPTSSLVREPYVPIVNRPQNLVAADLNLDLCPSAPLFILPNKGSYFGGDLMAGLVTADFNRSEEVCLLVDVGTNAEVVLGQRDWLIGAAGAAGPALEGGVAAMGMTAAPGAIDRVRIDRTTRAVSYTTLSGLPPRGICGSGLIDLLAEMYLSGIIDYRGRLTLSETDERRVMTDEGAAFVVAPAGETAAGEPILLSEVEIDILTRSKAAMYTILETVLLSVGMTFDQVARFYVAGTFGQYIDPRRAVAVGMLPDIPLSRYVPLGNSSLTGAVLALLSAEARAGALAAWQRLTYLELNVNQDLMNRFSSARFIPHTYRERFPSVGTLIR